MTTPELFAVPSAGRRRAIDPSGSLKYFYGPMDCGKSMLALQLDFNRTREGLRGILLTRQDRSTKPQISSRIGPTKAAVEASDETDLRALVQQSWSRGQPVDYLIIDEAQFFTETQVEQMAELADDVQVDVYAFGIATDFLGRMFPGSRRLFELADELLPLQVEVFCWCGRPARFNARVVDGKVARSGDQVVVADTGEGSATESAVYYRILCRQHYRRGDLGDS